MYSSCSDSAFQIWIGLSDFETVPGYYMYTDGTAVDYYNWAPGQPDDGNTPVWSEKCIALALDGKMHDDLCFRWLPFVCKLPLL